MIQMMMLAKLKAVAVVAAVALVLTTGLGVGLLPASAGDGLGSAPPTARTAPTAPPRSDDARVAARLKPADPHADDVTFLRRLSLDVRGTLPTAVETWFFVSDTDDDKRAKVVVWLTDDDAARAAVAKKLGVPVEKVRVVRAKRSADGKFVELALDTKDAKVVKPLVAPLTAFSPDGKKLIVNETYTELPDAKDGAVALWSLVRRQPLGERVWVAEPKAPGEAGFFRLQADTSELNLLWTMIDGDNPQPGTKWVVKVADGDGAFLKRVLTDARGNGPTALELKYFTEDKDPKKREKLIDTLLKDAAVQKKLGGEWKKKMLSFEVANLNTGIDYIYRLQSLPPEVTYPAANLILPVPPTPTVKPLLPAPPTPPVPPTPLTADVKVVKVPQADKLEKLVGELIAAKKSDDALLEAITLATLGRLPTDSEKRLATAVASTATDRKAAWVAVAHALAGAK